MVIDKVERDIAGRKLVIESGRVAKQADGAVLVSYGDTTILATVVARPVAEDRGFFPLFVETADQQGNPDDAPD